MKRAARLFALGVSLAALTAAGSAGAVVPSDSDPAAAPLAEPQVPDQAPGSAAPAAQPLDPDVAAPPTAVPAGTPSALDKFVPAQPGAPDAAKAPGTDTPSAEIQDAEAGVLLSPVSAALRDLLGDGEAAASQTGDKALVAEFYLEREWQPAWIVGDRLSEQALAVRDVLSRAWEDGLDPAAYPLPKAEIGAGIPATPLLLAEAEIELTRSVLAYSRDAMSGRVRPSDISTSISIQPPVAGGIESLDAITTSDDPAGTLLGFNPPHEGYRLLRAELARLRAAESGSADTGPLPVPEGKLMRRGLRDLRVVILRQHLGVPVPDADADLFDREVEAAVIGFQRENRLYADGIVGPRTLTMINGADHGDPIADVIANMERWRWLPRDLGNFRVMVNVPEFMVRVMRGDEVTHITRVVVGKNSNKTPIFSDEMEHLIVNPYWNVPRSITSNEMLPKIRRDPYSFFARHNYEVLANGRRIDPLSVDWWSGGHRYVRIRQRPGNSNALGRIKFMFPNKHSVYLHDTPSKSLFNRSVRAFSHGCVRVFEPMKFADALLVDNPDWDAKRLSRLFGGRSRQVNLDTHIPVHITYFTAWVDETGTLQRRPDIYGHNAKVIDSLGLEDKEALKTL